jgi:hypothetical protein
MLLQEQMVYQQSDAFGGLAPQQGETSPQPAAAPQPAAESASSSEAAIPEWVRDPEQAYKVIQDVRDENAKFRNELKELQTLAKTFETEAAKRAEVELQEQGKWQELAQQREKELADLRGKLEAERVTLLKENAALKFNLPPELAVRLQGANAEEIAADAEALAKLIPTATPSGQNWQNRTQQAAPGGNPAGLTYEQLKQRHYGQTAGNVFGTPLP